MPIVAVTTTTKTPGSRGVISAIARALNVNRATVSQVNAGKKKSKRITAALREYQTTGRIGGLAQ